MFTKVWGFESNLSPSSKWSILGLLGSFGVWFLKIAAKCHGFSNDRRDFPFKEWQEYIYIYVSVEHPPSLGKPQMLWDFAWTNWVGAFQNSGLTILLKARARRKVDPTILNTKHDYPISWDWITYLYHINMSYTVIPPCCTFSEQTGILWHLWSCQVPPTFEPDNPTKSRDALQASCSPPFFQWGHAKDPRVHKEPRWYLGVFRA